MGIEEWQQARELLQWNTHTANAYLKIGQWIADLKINSYNLELLDTNTIKTLCRNKYLEVWYLLAVAASFCNRSQSIDAGYR
ncbi:MAG: hypothetical protein RM338_03655 [Nostoc sp. DedQUE12a]|nr:hypothetical protein [Nostoc sp. DedQUE12a]